MENVFYLFLGAVFTLTGFFIKHYLTRQEKYDNYKLSAAEKRLDIHQKAYALTFDIQKATAPEKFDGIFNKMHQWWIENNFYLGPKARKAFRDCYWELLIFQKKTTDSNIVERRMYFNKTLLPNTRKIITEEIGLNWLGNQENGAFWESVKEKGTSSQVP